MSKYKEATLAKAPKSQPGSVPGPTPTPTPTPVVTQPTSQAAVHVAAEGKKRMGFKVDTTKAKKTLILKKGRYIGVKTKFELGDSSTGRPMVTRHFILSDDNEPVNGIENRTGTLVEVDDQVSPGGTELMHWSMVDEDGLSSWMNEVIAMGAPAEDVIDNPDLDIEEVEAATVGQPVILIIDIDKKRNPAQPQNIIRGILPEAV